MSSLSRHSRHLAVALTLLFWSEGALAEPDVRSRAPNDVTASSEAESHYKDGVRAYAAGRYREALELFRDADRRAPSAALSFNMARAYAQLKDDPSALRSYREYLRRAENSADAAEVRRTVEALSRRLADRGIQQVTVLSTPPGATVFLDGERVGVTPFTTETTPRAHTVTLRLEGYAEENRRFQLPVNDALDVRVALQQESAARSSSAEVAERPPARPRKPAAERSLASKSVSKSVSKSTPARPLRTVGIVALGAGGAALGGAVAFELLRRDAEQKAKNEHEQVRLADEVDTIQSRRTAARIFGGVGAGLAAVGGVLLLVSPNAPADQDRGAQMKLNVTMTALTATVAGRF
jgi:tetratricopeptide (TPR) repeat protein